LSNFRVTKQETGLNPGVRKDAEPGFAVKGAGLWYARDLQDKHQLWAYQLSDVDISELDAAVARVQDLSVELKVNQ
jgi:hypothetical protein